MKLRRVNPTKIVVPDVRVTARMDDEKAEQFKSSVKAIGIDEPIKCYEVDGELVLSDGLHRLQEALANRMPLIDVYVREGTMVDVLCNNLMSGHLRGTHPVNEMVRSIEELWKEHKMDSEQIAAKTGLTRDYVENLQLISELTPMCRQALDDGDIKQVGLALALTRVKDPVVQETLLGQLLLRRWTVKEFNEHVSNVLTLRDEGLAAPPQEVPELPEIRCYFCRQVTEISDISNKNICTSCAGILLQAQAQARAELNQNTPPKTE